MFITDQIQTFFSKDRPSTDHLFWKYRPNSPNFLKSTWGIMATLIKHILIPLNTVNYMVENRIPYSQPNLSSCLLYLALSLYPPPPSYRIVSFILIHKKKAFKLREFLLTNVGLQNSHFFFRKSVNPLKK